MFLKKFHKKYKWQDNGNVNASCRDLELQNRHAGAAIQRSKHGGRGHVPAGREPERAGVRPGLAERRGDQVPGQGDEGRGPVAQGQRRGRRVGEGPGCRRAPHRGRAAGRDPHGHRWRAAAGLLRRLDRDRVHSVGGPAGSRRREV